MNTKKLILNKKNITSFTLLLLLTLFVTFFFSKNVYGDTLKVNKDSDISLNNYNNSNTALLYSETDSLNRPIMSHYMGSNNDQVGKRVGSPSNPSNIDKKEWINFKIDKRWFWDRGHLIGNQFAGYASNNSSNIVGETYYTNQILMTHYEGGKKSSNDNALDNWLYLHPNYVIDYKVSVIYLEKSNKYPKEITLRYRGINKKTGEPVEIQIPKLLKDGVKSQTTDYNFYTTVVLENIVPGYNIDYDIGTVNEKKISNK